MKSRVKTSSVPSRLDLIAYARRFGMHNLSEANLHSDATLSLTKGSVQTSYSKITPVRKLGGKFLRSSQSSKLPRSGRRSSPRPSNDRLAGSTGFSAHDVGELVAGLRTIDAHLSSAGLRRRHYMARHHNEYSAGKRAGSNQGQFVVSECEASSRLFCQVEQFCNNFVAGPSH